MINKGKSYVYVSLLLIFLILASIQSGSATYEFKVRPGASMEYEVTKAGSMEGSMYSISMFLKNGTYITFNVSKGTSFKVEVENVSTDDVLGSLSITDNKLGTLISPNISLTSVSMGAFNIQFVEKVTDKASYVQWAQTFSNQELQGNLFTVTNEWQLGGGRTQKLHTSVNVISGFVEFFSFIFLVNESIEEVFSITRTSPTVPGYGFSVSVLSLIMLCFILKKSKRN